ncbi:hypothetical protein BCD49_39680 [Pseudofrankia sp. EUN1h]|nr:hypothetical protein BCD49_39680 [Pseudofrankia sp. EUN1h]
MIPTDIQVGIRPVQETPANGDGSPRLRPGQLAGQVLELLRARPTAAFSVADVAREIVRSTGAVGPALDRLTKAGAVHLVCPRPRLYQCAPHPVEPPPDGTHPHDQPTVDVPNNPTRRPLMLRPLAIIPTGTQVGIRPVQETPANGDGSPRLRPGQLPAQILELLRAHPHTVVSAPDVARELRRSIGAVTTALDRLTTIGLVRLVSPRPRLYQLRQHPAEPATAAAHGSTPAAPMSLDDEPATLSQTDITINVRVQTDGHGFVVLLRLDPDEARQLGGALTRAADHAPTTPAG